MNGLMPGRRMLPLTVGRHIPVSLKEPAGYRLEVTGGDTVTVTGSLFNWAQVIFALKKINSGGSAEPKPEPEPKQEPEPKKQQNIRLREAAGTAFEASEAAPVTLLLFTDTGSKRAYERIYKGASSAGQKLPAGTYKVSVKAPAGYDIEIAGSPNGEVRVTESFFSFQATEIIFKLTRTGGSEEPNPNPKPNPEPELKPDYPGKIWIEVANQNEYSFRNGLIQSIYRDDDRTADQKTFRSKRDFDVRVPYGVYKVSVEPIPGYKFSLQAVENDTIEVNMASQWSSGVSAIFALDTGCRWGARAGAGTAAGEIRFDLDSESGSKRVRLQSRSIRSVSILPRRRPAR